MHARVPSGDGIPAGESDIKSYEYSKFTLTMYDLRTEIFYFCHRKTCCWLVCIVNGDTK